MALHLLTSIQHELCVEIFLNTNREPMWHDLQVDPPKIPGGYMHLASDPGLGIKLNEEAIAR